VHGIWASSPGAPIASLVRRESERKGTSRDRQGVSNAERACPPREITLILLSAQGQTDGQRSTGAPLRRARWTTSTAGRRKVRATQVCVSEQVQGHASSARPVGAGGAAGLGPGARPGGGLVAGLQRGAARPRARGGRRTTATATAKRLAADGWGCGACTSEAPTRRAGDLHARTTCTAAGVASSGGRGGARHPRPPARHWAAVRQHPSPRPAARVRRHAAERLAAGGAEAWPHAGQAGRQVQPGVVRGARAAAGL